MYIASLQQLGHLDSSVPCQAWSRVKVRRDPIPLEQSVWIPSLDSQSESLDRRTVKLLLGHRCRRLDPPVRVSLLGSGSVDRALCAPSPGPAYLWLLPETHSRAPAIPQ